MTLWHGTGRLNDVHTSCWSSKRDAGTFGFQTFFFLNSYLFWPEIFVDLYKISWLESSAICYRMAMHANISRESRAENLFVERIWSLHRTRWSAPVHSTAFVLRAKRGWTIWTILQASFVKARTTTKTCMFSAVYSSHRWALKCFAS